MFAVPLRDIVRIHSSSGTTGKPTVVGYTRNDLENWKNLVARIMIAGGVTANDIVHIAFTYGLFTGGFGLHYAAEHIGASVIPVSSGKHKKADYDYAGLQKLRIGMHPFLCSPYC